MPIIIDLSTAGSKAPEIARKLIFQVPKDNWKYDKNTKILAFDLTPDKHEALIANIYKEFNAEKIANKNITINPPDKGFKSAAEKEDDQVKELAKNFPFRVFLRTDGPKSVIDNPLPARRNTPAAHMMIFDPDPNNYVNSGYLSVFEGYTGLNNRIAFEETNKIASLDSHFHVLFTPNNIKQINLNDESAKLMPEADSGPLVFDTTSVHKLWIIPHDKNGTANEIVKDTSGRRAMIIDEHLLSGPWPEGMIEMSFPVRQLDKIKEIFTGSKTPAELFMKLDNAIKQKIIEPSYYAVVKKGQAELFYKEDAAKKKDPFAAWLADFINTNKLAYTFTDNNINIRNLSEANKLALNEKAKQGLIKCEIQKNDECFIMLSPGALPELQQLLTPAKASPSADKDKPSEFYQSLLAAITQWGTGEQGLKAAQAASLLEGGGKQSKEKLAQQAKNYGFTCTDVDRDGNCFFHAVAAQLRLRGGAEYRNYTDAQLRTIAIQHIINNRNLYENAIPGGFASFIAQNMEQGTWADNIMIQALSRELNINVVVIRNDGARPNIIRQSVPETTVYLGYEVGQHYQSLSGQPTNQTLFDRFHEAAIDRVVFQPINHPAPPAVVPAARAQQSAVENAQSDLVHRRQDAILSKSIAELNHCPQIQILTQFVQALPTLMVEADKLNEACKEFLASQKDFLQAIYKKLPLSESEFAKIGELIKSREGELTALAKQVTNFCGQHSINLKVNQPEQISHSMSISAPVPASASKR